ncbi:hypothetical protein V8G54_009389 [Vigna mungo]|uniref:Uncharacterized protein n=1 Tax=Vigna mungo TaxID=3915 RepID=A0AAQ3NWN5_VIGMU
MKKAFQFIGKYKGTNIESYEFEWRLRLENSIVEPSFRTKFLSIFTPNGGHPTHTIGHIVNSITPFQFVPIRKNIICLCHSPIHRNCRVKSQGFCQRCMKIMHFIKGVICYFGHKFIYTFFTFMATSHISHFLYNLFLNKRVLAEHVEEP